MQGKGLKVFQRNLLIWWGIIQRQSEWIIGPLYDYSRIIVKLGREGGGGAK
jgi:hypothetical protein